MSVKHRTFGRTGIRVSEVIFGAGAVGGILIHKDDATKREPIRRAIAGGINWIDTAAQALKAAEMGPLPAHLLARLDALYESDFRRV